jgi:hypothetical protein
MPIGPYDVLIDGEGPDAPLASFDMSRLSSVFAFSCSRKADVSIGILLRTPRCPHIDRPNCPEQARGARRTIRTARIFSALTPQGRSPGSAGVAAKV